MAKEEDFNKLIREIISLAEDKIVELERINENPEIINKFSYSHGIQALRISMKMDLIEYYTFSNIFPILIEKMEQIITKIETQILKWPIGNRNKNDIIDIKGFLSRLLLKIQTDEWAQLKKETASADSASNKPISAPPEEKEVIVSNKIELLLGLCLPII